MIVTDNYNHIERLRATTISLYQYFFQKKRTTIKGVLKLTLSSLSIFETHMICSRKSTSASFYSTVPNFTLNKVSPKRQMVAPDYITIIIIIITIVFNYYYQVHCSYLLSIIWFVKLIS